MIKPVVLIRYALLYCITICCLLFSFPSGAATGDDVIVIKPEEYPLAFRNPLAGFRTGYPNSYATLNKTYIKWSDLEERESDGIEKIRNYCDRIWRGYPEHNMKAIPRVWLYMPNQPDKHGWPVDLERGDYSSARFKDRVAKLIRKLGAAWDNDPRVAYVEMGIIGYWGEHHHPVVTKEMEKILGDAFSAAFKNKLVMIRYPRDFRDYAFGFYWDSWAHIGQTASESEGGAGIAALTDRWKSAVIGGEVAYDWGNHIIQPGKNPNDTLTDPEHLNYLLDTVRKYHCNHLGIIADYDRNIPSIAEGAEEVQKALGYRFVIDEARFPSQLHASKEFTLSFTVRNIGSSPFYYSWPVELSLLDPATRQPVWKATFKGIDIRQWLPGDRWETVERVEEIRPGMKDSRGKIVDLATITDRKAYTVPERKYEVVGRFQLPAHLKQGQYIVALAIVDPAGMLPSARFAIKNYFTGGRHPLARVAIDTTVNTPILAPETFDDLQSDDTLHYTM